MEYPRKFDRALGRVVAFIPRRIHRIMFYVSVVGGSAYALSVLLLIGVLSVKNKDEALLRYVLWVALTAPLAELIKLITRRQRPKTLYVENMKLKTYSFPSGHSYVSALISGFIVVLAHTYLGFPFDWIISLVAMTFSLSVGISRAYLGAHFPSDVVAGWSLGVVVSVLLALKFTPGLL